jgi:hypothetical protein
VSVCLESSRYHCWRTIICVFIQIHTHTYIEPAAKRHAVAPSTSSSSADTPASVPAPIVVPNSAPLPFVGGASPMGLSESAGTPATPFVPMGNAEKSFSSSSVPPSRVSESPSPFPHAFGALPTTPSALSSSSVAAAQPKQTAYTGFGMDTDDGPVPLYGGPLVNKGRLVKRKQPGVYACVCMHGIRVGSDTCMCVCVCVCAHCKRNFCLVCTCRY